jgi:hypothetical protein
LQRWEPKVCGCFDRDKGWSEVFRDEQYGDASYGASFARDGHLAVTSFDGLIHLYEYDAGTDNPNFRRVGGLVKAPSGHFPFRIAFSPTGELLAERPLTALGATPPGR